MYEFTIIIPVYNEEENLERVEKELAAYMERVHPGRWDTVRQPTEEELKQTGIVELSLDEASGKVMPTAVAPYLLPGGPLEAPEDSNVSPWTGIVKTHLKTEAPVSSDQLTGKI